MNKMLVIKDLPEHLEGKKLFVEFTIYGAEEEGVVPTEVGIHGRQRLKPMPERQELFGNEWERLTKTYGRGWNDCLDEILGEKE